jgi:hypothetical protein
MKLISWNLNHRTLEKPIPPDVLRFFEEFDADLISLNEYVDGPSRGAFKNGLQKIGYTHQLISQRFGNNNQIFIASKHPIILGELTAPQLTDAAVSNFLHVKLEGSDIEIVGLRAPAYKVSAERVEYWKQLAEIIRSTSTRKIIFVGDVNYDPFTGVAASVPSLSFGLEGKFYIPNPTGEWSFISIDGKNRTRIDHAIVSEGLRVAGVEYLNSFNGITLAGSKDMKAITDHAVLALDFN